MISPMRVARFLAKAGLGSRRRCEEYVRQGRVRVNGAVVESVGDQIDPECDRVEVDGRQVSLSRDLVTIMVHKPAGYVTTCCDPQGRPIILDLLPPSIRSQGLFPVGRLDKDTEGLLLLTNDGELSFRLTHPRFGVEKVYRVWVKGTVTDTDREQLEQGVPLGELISAPAKVTRLDRKENETELELVIHEGRKRQVRRMLRAVGYRVVRLVRVKLGPLALGELPLGGWRFLQVEEVAKLRSACEPAEKDSGTSPAT
jgi:23S rRNA pseudouridine2605 synthase